MPVGTTNQLEMRWVPVTDPNGRTRMEAVWVTPSLATTAVATTVASDAA